MSPFLTKTKVDVWTETSSMKKGISRNLACFPLLCLRLGRARKHPARHGVRLMNLIMAPNPSPT